MHFFVWQVDRMQNEQLEAEFLETMEAAIERHGYHVTQFGRDSIGDPNLVFRVRKGRSPTLRTAQRVLNFIRNLDNGT